MQQQLTINSLSELDLAAEEFLRRTKGNRLIAFYAPMGAGKTTFISALCRCLGVSAEEISSPSFSIVNEYRTNGGDTIYHFDFYRLKDEREALDIGLYEYLDSDCMCLMEWPENIEDLLPEETLKVQIKLLSDGSRELCW